jgi:hypothetical protein
MLAAIALAPSAAMAAVGDAAVTEHGSLAVVDQPADVILGPDESIELTVDVDITCAMVTAVGADQIEPCGEVCAKGLIVDFGVEGSTEVGLTATDQCATYGSWSSGTHFVTGDAFSTVLSSTADYDGSPLTVHGTFRVVDLGGPEDCTDDAEWFDEPDSDPSDSTQLRLEIGVNGGTTDRDGEVVPAARPGGTSDVQFACYTADPCREQFPDTPCWIEPDEEVSDLPADCLEPVRAGICAQCDLTASSVAPTTYVTGTRFECATACPPGEVLEGGSCVGEEVTPGVCPEVARFELPKAEFGSKTIRLPKRRRPDGSTCKRSVDKLGVGDTLCGFQAYEKSMCRDPGRARLTAPGGEAIESQIGFYGVCASKRLKFMELDADHHPVLEFTDPGEPPSADCSYKLKRSWVTGSGLDSPGAAKLRIKPRKGEMVPGPVDFEKFRFKGVQGTAAESSLEMEVTLVEERPGGKTKDKKGAVGVCAVPEAVRAGSAEPLAAGGYRFTDFEVLPESYSFLGRKVQEAVFPSEGNTCGTLFERKRSEVQARLNVLDFSRFDCSAPQPGFPQAVRDDICPGGTIDRDVATEVEEGVVAQLKALKRCFDVVADTDNPNWVEVSKPNNAERLAGMVDTIGLVFRNADGTADLGNDLCYQFATAMLEDGQTFEDNDDPQHACSDAVGQAWRVSCDRATEDVGTPAESLVFFEQSISFELTGSGMSLRYGESVPRTVPTPDKLAFRRGDVGYEVAGFWADFEVVAQDPSP